MECSTLRRYEATALRRYEMLGRVAEGGIGSMDFEETRPYVIWAGVELFWEMRARAGRAAI